MRSDAVTNVDDPLVTGDRGRRRALLRQHGAVSTCVFGVVQATQRGLIGRVHQLTSRKSYNGSTVTLPERRCHTPRVVFVAGAFGRPAPADSSADPADKSSRHRLAARLS